MIKIEAKLRYFIGRGKYNPSIINEASFLDYGPFKSEFSF